jgi:bla regulator protein blaR1
MTAGVVAAALFDSLWQAPAMAFLVWLWLRVLRGCSSATQAAAWSAGAVASVALPLATALAQAEMAPATDRAFAIGAPIVSSILPLRTLHVVHAFVVYDRVALAVAILWACVSGALLIRLLADVVILERIKREAMPIDVVRRAKMPRWVAAGKGTRGVRLCTSGEIDVPMAIGLFDALVVLPESLFDQLDAGAIDRIALHELSHVRRRDDWQRLAMRAAIALLWFNPAIYFIVGRAELEREITCDDAALEGEATPDSYVTSLVDLARTLQGKRRVVTAPGIFDTRRALSLRIERALERGTQAVRSRTAMAFAGTALAAVACFAIARTFEPTIAFANVLTGGIHAPLRTGETRASRTALLAVLAGFSQGAIDPRALGSTAPSRDDAKIVEGIAATMSQLGPPIDVEVRKVEREADRRIFTYRVRYERDDVDYLIWLDTHDRVRGASFTFERRPTT